MELATNSFNKGMLLDTHPMVAGNDSLTDVLNGTFITMNGNELILQNDMGNRKVDTAFLPAGYEPVGIKEFGGIIYVAAYNPITNKSLLGSFPSPKRKYTEETGDKVATFEFSDFYKNNVETLDEINYDGDKVNYLKQDSFLIPLLINKELINLKAGDKFALYSQDLKVKNVEDDFKKNVSNYFNTTNEKITTPKNKQYTFALGVLNSQNEFVDITKSLKRWDGDSKIINTADTSDNFKFNVGYFISKDFTAPQAESDEEELINKRNKIAANTYSYKLNGPLYLKVSINHIQNISYDISIDKISDVEDSEDKKKIDFTVNARLEYNCPDGIKDSVQNRPNLAPAISTPSTDFSDDIRNDWTRSEDEGIINLDQNNDPVEWTYYELFYNGRNLYPERFFKNNYEDLNIQIVSNYLHTETPYEIPITIKTTTVIERWDRLAQKWIVIETSEESTKSVVFYEEEDPKDYFDIYLQSADFTQDDVVLTLHSNTYTIEGKLYKIKYTINNQEYVVETDAYDELIPITTDYITIGENLYVTNKANPNIVSINVAKKEFYKREGLEDTEKDSSLIIAIMDLSSLDYGVYAVQSKFVLSDVIDVDSPEAIKEDFTIHYQWFEGEEDEIPNPDNKDYLYYVYNELNPVLKISFKRYINNLEHIILEGITPYEFKLPENAQEFILYYANDSVNEYTSKRSTPAPVLDTNRITSYNFNSSSYIVNIKKNFSVITDKSLIPYTIIVPAYYEGDGTALNSGTKSEEYKTLGEGIVDFKGFNLIIGDNKARENAKDKYYIKSLNLSGNIQVDLINTGTFNVSDWRYYNSKTERNTTLTYGFNYYPEKGKDLKKLVFVFKDINSDLIIFIGKDGETDLEIINGQNTISFDWDEHGFNPRKLYKVDIYYQTNTSLSGYEKVVDSAGNIFFGLKLDSDNLWFLTTELLNTKYNIHLDDFVPNFSKIDTIPVQLAINPNIQYKDLSPDVTKSGTLLSKTDSNLKYTFTNRKNITIDLDPTYYIEDIENLPDFIELANTYKTTIDKANFSEIDTSTINYTLNNWDPVKEDLVEFEDITISGTKILTGIKFKDVFESVGVKGEVQINHAFDIIDAGFIWDNFVNPITNYVNIGQAYNGKADTHWICVVHTNEAGKAPNIFTNATDTVEIDTLELSVSESTRGRGKYEYAFSSIKEAVYELFDKYSNNQLFIYSYWDGGGNRSNNGEGMFQTNPSFNVVDAKRFHVNSSRIWWKSSGNKWTLIDPGTESDLYPYLMKKPVMVNDLEASEKSKLQLILVDLFITDKDKIVYCSLNLIISSEFYKPNREEYYYNNRYSFSPLLQYTYTKKSGLQLKDTLPDTFANLFKLAQPEYNTESLEINIESNEEFQDEMVSIFQTSFDGVYLENGLMTDKNGNRLDPKKCYLWNENDSALVEHPNKYLTSDLESTVNGVNKFIYDCPENAETSLSNLRFDRTGLNHDNATILDFNRLQVYIPQNQTN